MPIAYSAAVDEMFGMLNDLFIATTINNIPPTISGTCGYEPDVRWPGQPNPDQVPMDKIWVKPSVQIVKDSLASLSNSGGKRLYEATGLLYLQIFCPRNIASTLDKGRTVAKLVQDAFRKESQSGSIWFRNQRIIELPATDENYPIHFITEFTYRGEA